MMATTEPERASSLVQYGPDDLVSITLPARRWDEITEERWARGYPHTETLRAFVPGHELRELRAQWIVRHARPALSIIGLRQRLTLMADYLRAGHMPVSHFGYGTQFGNTAAGGYWHLGMGGAHANVLLHLVVNPGLRLPNSTDETVYCISASEHTAILTAVTQCVGPIAKHWGGREGRTSSSFLSMFVPSLPEWKRTTPPPLAQAHDAPLPAWW